VLKISILCGNVNINFTQKTCVSVNSLMMVLQDWSILEWTRGCHLQPLVCNYGFYFILLQIREMVDMNQLKL